MQRWSSCNFMGLPLLLTSIHLLYLSTGQHRSAISFGFDFICRVRLHDMCACACARKRIRFFWGGYTRRIVSLVEVDEAVRFILLPRYLDLFLRCLQDWKYTFIRIFLLLNLLVKILNWKNFHCASSTYIVQRII